MISRTSGSLSGASKDLAATVETVPRDLLFPKVKTWRMSGPEHDFDALVVLVAESSVGRGRLFERDPVGDHE